MNYEIYKDIEVKNDFSVFEFTSTGPRGAIRKHVSFTQMEDPAVVSLAFGDIVGEGLPASDRAVSDNGDRNKVLATVAEIVSMYTKAFPGRWVVFRGSTEARTRLYRIAIDLNFQDLSNRFDVFGLHPTGDAEPFTKNRRYFAFLIRRKKL